MTAGVEHSMLSAATADRAVARYRCDIDENKSLASQQEVDTIPTLIIYKDGREVWRHAGETDVDTLLHQVESYI